MLYLGSSLNSPKTGRGEFCSPRGRVSLFVFLGEFYPDESGLQFFICLFWSISLG